MIPNDKTLVLTNYISNSKPPFKTMFFKPNSRKAIFVLYTILGHKNDDDQIDETQLSFLAYTSYNQGVP